MKIYETLEQGTEEWLKVRLGKFTASDALAIATNGVGLETLCYQKVAELKTGKPAKEEYSNSDIERGNEFEDLARSTYEVETGIVVLRVGFVEKNKRKGCSPDGLIGEDGMQEIKCPNDVNFLKYLVSKEIPKKHYLQMQMQMDVCDRKWCDYVVFNGNFENSISITRVERDDVAIEKIRLGYEKGCEIMDDILTKI